MPTHYKGTPQEILALNTFIKLTRATDSLMSRLSQRQTWGELTPSQFGVLESLYHLGPMRLGEICAKQLKSGGNMTLVVDNLEKHGLAQRGRDPADRRAVVVTLTEPGRILIEQLLPRHVADVVAEMSILASEEQETLGHLCRVLGLQQE